MRAWLFFRAFVISLTLTATAAASEPAETSKAPINVTVAGYLFEPFVTETGGLTPDLIGLLNEAQDDYHFSFMRIPAQRRYRLMETGKIDAVFFEMPRWAWQENGVAHGVTPVILRDAEIFMARREKAAAPDFFNRVGDHRIAAVRGYHYKFAGFEADAAQLKQKFSITLADNQQGVMTLVEQDAADIGIVGRSFLIGEMLRQPDLLNKVIVSPEADQVFLLPMLVRQDGPVSAEALTAILTRLHEDGRLPRFFTTRGLGPLYVWPGKP